MVGCRATKKAGGYWAVAGSWGGSAGQQGKASGQRGRAGSAGAPDARTLSSSSLSCVSLFTAARVCLMTLSSLLCSSVSTWFVDCDAGGTAGGIAHAGVAEAQV